MSRDPTTGEDAEALELAKQFVVDALYYGALAVAALSEGNSDAALVYAQASGTHAYAARTIATAARRSDQ